MNRTNLCKKFAKRITVAPVSVAELDFMDLSLCPGDSLRRGNSILRYSMNVVGEDKATLGSDLGATTTAYSISTVASLLPSVQHYAGAHNAINPGLYNRSWPTHPCGLSRSETVYNS